MRTASASRRAFLESGLGLTGALLVGCHDEPLAGTDSPPDAGPCAQPEPPADASFLGLLPFINEGDLPLETPLGVGLDGRLLSDLSALTPTNLITSNEHFYVRTRYPDLLDPRAPWRIRITGMVDTASELDLDSILARERFLGTHLLECSGNSIGGHFGLLSAADWHGLPLLELLDDIPRSAQATRVGIAGFDRHSQPSANNHSTPGASWIMSFDQIASSGAFLATKMNGAPLPPDHGAPLRLVVPGWYGCTCIKWVDEISFLDESAAATGQMQEFAGRTHQPEVFALARDYLPATIDAAAMPTRVERWQLADSIVYRVVGIRWGGNQPLEQLSIQYADGPWQTVTLCPPQPDPRTWSLWTHLWHPPSPGDYAIKLRVDAPAVRQRRLDLGYYIREIRIASV